MNRDLPDETRATLPLPYREASFKLRQVGIFDDKDVTVFTDAENAFAVLHPSPLLDYSHYMPRQQRLGLGAYKKTLNVVDRRFAKIEDLFPHEGSVLEIGAAEGGFLARLREARKNLALIAIEPDLETKPARDALGLVGQYPSLADAIAANIKVDLICLFHVFEHINRPELFLAQIRSLLTPTGSVVIEVPSLDDPLLSIYETSSYSAFYFQRQHPFVYSGRSLSRVLAANGFNVSEVRPYQRYGLENHIAWLRDGRPGGDAVLASMFASVDGAYRAALEEKGKTDTVFAVARPA
jgi:SAM-dependent methyltransferase